MKDLTQEQKNLLRKAERLEQQAEQLESLDDKDDTLAQTKALYREAAEYRIEVFE